MYPGTDLYDIEWMLLDKYDCYHWNSGDFHQNTEQHIGDVKDYMSYYEVAYEKKENILIINRVGFIVDTKRIECNRIVEESHDGSLLRFGIRTFHTLPEYRKMKIDRICSKLEK
jgi:hypothetical protein